jgi:hypothetical protein
MTVDVEWAGLVATILTAAVTGAWAVLKWSQERRKDRLTEQNRLAALYVSPFLFACQDLQSRLFNILCLGGLQPLKARGGYAEETLCLVAQYFAYEAPVLRYTPYGTDPRLLRRIEKVRRDFAAAAGEDIDPWCIFRHRQRELGRFVRADQRDDQAMHAEVMTLREFEKRIRGAAGSLQVSAALFNLREAEEVNDLDARSRLRLALVQSDLVDLLGYLEAELQKLRTSRLRSLARNLRSLARRLTRAKPRSSIFGGERGRALDPSLVSRWR